MTRWTAKNAAVIAKFEDAAFKAEILDHIVNMNAACDPVRGNRRMMNRVWQVLGPAGGREAEGLNFSGLFILLGGTWDEIDEAQAARTYRNLSNLEVD